jgi:predicted NACHT family NTPase
MKCCGGAAAAVLLLDGLDEIFDQNRRNDALNDIHRFSNDYPDTPVIVTSRIIGYQQRRLSDAGFRHFMLQDLEDAQITEFLRPLAPDLRRRSARTRRQTAALGRSHPRFARHPRVGRQPAAC